MATRWGIAGCGKISNDFVNALRALPKEDHVFYACAARDLGKSQEFLKKYGGKVAYDSYAKLAANSEIDVVYVGVLNAFHLEVVELLLNAGKNVLCEKPLGLNVRQTKRMVDLARKKKLFLMEAVWSRCCPVYKELDRIIKAGEIGEIEHVMASFGFEFEDKNVLHKTVGGSASLLIGIYLIQLSLLAFRGQKPDKIVATGHLNKNGVDDVLSVTLIFPNGKVATLCCNTNCTLPNEAAIAGSKGIVKIPSPFWCPESLITPTGTFTSNLPTVQGSKFTYPNSQGLMYEAEEVRQCLKSGQLESSKIPLDETVLLAEILENILQQMGVDYSDQ